MPRQYTFNGNAIDPGRFEAMRNDRSVRHMMSLAGETEDDDEQHAFSSDDDLDAFARRHPKLQGSFEAARRNRDTIGRHLSDMSDEQLSAYRAALDGLATATDASLGGLLTAMFPGAAADHDKVKAFFGPKSGSVEFFDYTNYTRGFHSVAGLFHMPMPFLGSWDNHLSSLRLYGPVSIQLFDGPMFTGGSRIYGAWPFQSRSISLAGDWFNNRTSSWLFHI